MIFLKNTQQIKKLRKSGKLVAEYLQMVIDIVEAGQKVSTLDLDKLAVSFAKKNGAVPSFKNYRGFPYSICASINDEVVHGMPNDKPLQEGDILSVDYGILLNGYHGDSAITVPIGKITDNINKLIKTGQECLYRGIGAFCEGSRLNRISYAIQTHAENNGYNVVRDYVGHGVGKDLHEDPQVYNFTDKPDEGLLLKNGMVIAIEPMVVEGDYLLNIDNNGWTVRTADHGLAVHWEHTIALINNDIEILTLRKGENYEPYRN